MLRTLLRVRYSSPPSSSSYSSNVHVYIARSGYTKLSQEQMQHRRNVLAALKTSVAATSGAEGGGPLAEQQLTDTIAAFIRTKDLVLAGDLVKSVALRTAGFDAGQELVSYYIAELLGSPVPTTESLESAVEVIEAMNRLAGTNELHRPNALVLQLVLEGVCDAGADTLMDRLLLLLKSPASSLQLTVDRIEQVISLVYLRSLRWDAVISLLKYSHQQGLSVSPALWQEMFEVCLQPKPTDRCTWTEAASRVTPLRFDRLQTLLATLPQKELRLTPSALAALRAVMSKTVVPRSFIEFLDKHNP